MITQENELKFNARRKVSLHSKLCNFVGNFRKVWVDEKFSQILVGGLSVVRTLSGS